MMTSPMHSEPPFTVGELLAAWRTRVAHLSQDQVAAWFGFSGEAVSQWESGTRLMQNNSQSDDDRDDIDENRLDRLDRNFGANGVFERLARAIGSPHGLPPRKRWNYNFPKGWSPIWIWIRPKPKSDSVDAELRWGPLRMLVHEKCGPGGIMVTVPASVSNPALIVLSEKPGWVDFGTGIIRPELGYPLIPASTQIFARAFPHSIVQVKELLGISAPRTSLQEDQLPSDEVAEFSGNDLRRLRLSRLLTQRDVAKLVTELGANESVNNEPVNESQILRLESDGGIRPRGVRSRLDMVYEADGHSCCEEYPWTSSEQRSERNVFTHSVKFPAYWRGPVWLMFRGPDGASRCSATLQWGPWSRTVEVESGAVLTTRKARSEAPVLHVTLPPSWTLRPGMGVHRLATDINNGWFFNRPDGQHPKKSLQAAKPVWDEIHGAYVRLAESGSETLVHLVKTIRHRTIEKRRDASREEKP
jgi:hypothetical protein